MDMWTQAVLCEGRRDALAHPRSCRLPTVGQLWIHAVCVITAGLQDDSEHWLNESMRQMPPCWHHVVVPADDILPPPPCMPACACPGTPADGIAAAVQPGAPAGGHPDAGLPGRHRAVAHQPLDVHQVCCLLTLSPRARLLAGLMAACRGDCLTSGTWVWSCPQQQNAQ